MDSRYCKHVWSETTQICRKCGIGRDEYEDFFEIVDGVKYRLGVVYGDEMFEQSTVLA